jgi:peroxiredoxin
MEVVMAEKKLITIGQKVRDFTLRDQNNEEVRLSDYQGKRVLLSFHPLAWTPICADQMKSLEALKKTLGKVNAIAFGISIDSVPCKAAWAKFLKITDTRLLSDFWPHGRVAKSLSLFRESEGFSHRANVITDEKGRVLFFKVYPIRQLPPVEELLAVLRV